jgi:hypothetical protein
MMKEGLKEGLRFAPAGLAGPAEKRYISGNLPYLIRSRIESGPSGTRSFLLPERPSRDWRLDSLQQTGRIAVFWSGLTQSKSEITNCPKGNF